MYRAMNDFLLRKKAQFCYMAYMKIILTKLSLTTAIVFLAFATTGIAQTQTVTLAVGLGNQSASYTCATNQIITILAFDGTLAGTFNYTPTVLLSFTNGVTYTNLFAASAIKVGDVFTGLTQISVSSFAPTLPGILTFSVTTPGSSSSPIPANAVVIPTDAKGPVQIVLESSSDLLNWTSSLPGIYGSTYTNRFFRVRAIAQ